MKDEVIVIANSKDKCPHCGADVYEDVWEIIHEENGSFEQEIIYPALICSKFCGFYKRFLS
ncbi:hypothetical protein [Bacillus sp. P14.5]|uniref:hypothetical protein n=1 Tax=Bacillus sp. P14.5 TaxID=1983400 RepID=UPI0013B0673D|nr:hypothetical protein [Bacillus sp. P14.5]